VLGLAYAVRPSELSAGPRKHVVFYKLTKSGVFIRRILHQGMIPVTHELLED
jgi:hypothetical protein